MHRINFHGGDQIFWSLPGAVNFRGRDQDWPRFLESFVQTHRITDIILFGDCRPRHRAAVMVANRLQVPVHVFEEGYIRPNWVTLERGGVNGHSDLPRDPHWYRERAARMQPPADPAHPVLSSFARRAIDDLVYNFGYMLLGWSFPFYRTHRPWHPLTEYAGWGMRLLRRRLTQTAIAASVAHAESLSNTYIFPLQLDCDSQIRHHSSIRGIAAAIEVVLTSFAAHAPSDTTLIVKEHPLDNGLRDWGRLVARTAERLGIADRVCFIEDGDLARLTGSARGMVTVNSTSGTLALAAGVPVITLGQAIYDMPGLTFQGSLAAFWTDASPPDADLFAAFRHVLTQQCLVRGGFFSDSGVALLTEDAAARLQAQPQGQAILPLADSGQRSRPGQPATALI